MRPLPFLGAEPHPFLGDYAASAYCIALLRAAATGNEITFASFFAFRFSPVNVGTSQPSDGNQPPVGNTIGSFSMPYFGTSVKPKNQYLRTIDRFRVLGQT